MGCQKPEDNTAPVISELVIYPSLPKAGQMVSLTGIASDEQGDRISYSWVASGGTFVDSLGSNPIIWQAPSEPDTITIYLHASDDELTTTASQSFYLDYGVGIVSGHITDFSTGFLLNGAVININGDEVTTGPDGYFRFTDVLSGNNIPISATAQNYVTYAEFIDVKVDENIVDISMTLLTEVGRIAGYVSDVVTEEKLEGVIVQTGDVIDTTEADGYYELYNVPISANVPVRAVLDGYAINASLINVSAGYNTHNIGLEPNTGTVSGRITAAADGALLEGVIVTVNQYEGMTNAAGYYQIEDIPVTSNASLSAELEGYVTSYAIIDIEGGVNNVDLQLGDNPGSLSGWVRNSLDGSILGNVAVQVGQSYYTSSVTGEYEALGLATGPTLVTCTVSGYATFTELFDIQEGDNLLDISLDPNVGEVMGFLRDSLAESSLVGKVISLGNLTTLSEIDGSFAFSNVPLGQHLLTCMLEDYEDYSYVLNVEAGSTIKNIFMIPTSGNVMGIVRDNATGTIIEGAEVSVDEDLSSSSNQILTTTTDENGYYEFLSVSQGTIRISCDAPYYIESESAIEISFGDNIQDINLDPGVGSIVGQVVNAADNFPIPGVLVEIGDLTDTTDTDGLYSFSHLDLTSTQVTVRKAGFTEMSQFIEVTVGENIANFELVADHGSLKGYVTDSSTGLALASAQVVLGPDTAITDMTGYYEFQAAPVAQSLLMEVMLTNYGTYSDWITLDVGENTADVSLLSTIGSLKGYVTDSETSAALPDAQVILGTDTTMTDVDGYYQFEEVIINESLVLKVSLEDYAEYSDWVTLDVGENTSDISLVTTLGSLRGFVTDSRTTQALESVTVILGADTVMTDMNGYYEFEDIRVVETLFLQMLLPNHDSHTEWLTLEIGDNFLDVSLVAHLSILHGYVRDSITDALLDSVYVVFQADTFVTLTNGYYEFDAVLPGTQDSLIVNREDYNRSSQWITLGPGHNVLNVYLDESD